MRLILSTHLKYCHLSQLGKSELLLDKSIAEPGSRVGKCQNASFYMMKWPTNVRLALAPP
jgi:hypothetical protein